MITFIFLLLNKNIFSDYTSPVSVHIIRASRNSRRESDAGTKRSLFMVDASEPDAVPMIQ